MFTLKPLTPKESKSINNHLIRKCSRGILITKQDDIKSQTITCVKDIKTILKSEHISRCSFYIGTLKFALFLNSEQGIYRELMQLPYDIPETDRKPNMYVWRNLTGVFIDSEKLPLVFGNILITRYDMQYLDDKSQERIMYCVRHAWDVEKCNFITRSDGSIVDLRDNRRLIGMFTKPQERLEEYLAQIKHF